jgi:beta-glucanase (GH16 family)
VACIVATPSRQRLRKYVFLKGKTFKIVNNSLAAWPRSGEIDLMELRGNRNLRDPNNGNIHVGVEQAASTMHFGPAWNVNAWPTAHYSQNRSPGFNVGYHVYRLRWTDSYIQFFIDGVSIGTVNAGKEKIKK